MTEACAVIPIKQIHNKQASLISIGILGAYNLANNSGFWC
jgi:hypothetical protein